MENISKTIFDIIFRPSEFFESVKDETTYTRPWLFFSIGYIIMLTISLMFSIPMLLRFSDIGLFLIIIQIFSFFISIFFALAIPFISAGIAHLGLLMMGANNGFYNTFKPISYSGVVYVMYALLTTVINGFGSLYITSEVTDFASYFEMLSYGINIPAILISLTVICITGIGMIHVLIIETIGVARFQQISITKAFFGIIIVPMIIFVLLGLIFGGFMLIFLSQGIPTGMVTFT